MTENEILKKYCININTLMNPFEILENRILELEDENKMLKKELVNYKRID